jgi:hypothetical protein
MARSGITVLVSSVNRDAGPASDGKAHLVRVEVTFVDTSGAHTVTPEEVAMRDSTGTMLLPGMDRAAAACGSGPPAQDLQSGQKAGPYPLCYAAAGAPSDRLTLVWVNPEDLSIVELTLPT